MQDPTLIGFHERFPEFTVTDYSDIVVQSWLTLFIQLYDKCRWGQFWEYGCYLFIAHNLVLSKKLLLDSPESAIDLGAGQITVSHKEVGPLYKTYSYSSKNTSLVNQGQWGLTLYGQQLYQIIRKVGIGMLYSGTNIGC